MDNNRRINFVSIFLFLLFLLALAAATFYVLRWWDYQEKLKTLSRLENVLNNPDTSNTYRYVLNQDKTINYSETEIRFISSGNISISEVKNSSGGIPTKLFILEGYTFSKNRSLRNLKIAIYATVDQKSDTVFNTFIKEAANATNFQINSSVVVIPIEILKSLFAKGTLWAISFNLTPSDTSRFAESSENFLYVRVVSSLKQDYYKKVKKLVDSGLETETNIILIPSSLYIPL